MTSSDHFAAAARRAGCPLDQANNFNHAGILPQPKQLAASAAARPVSYTHLTLPTILRV